MKIRMLSMTLILFCATAMLSSCSSPDSNTPAGIDEQKAENAKASHAAETQDRFNSCDLLTQSDILEFFPGAHIKITKQGDTPVEATGQRICFYDLSEDDMIFVQTELARTSDMAQELIKAHRNAGANYRAVRDIMDNPEKIGGIGIDAWYGGSGLRAGAGLHVLLDEDTAIAVTAGLGKGNDDKDAHIRIEKILAEKMIANLSRHR